MRSFVASALLVSSSVAAASASLAPRWDWPDAMPIEARQEPGTPRFQCHEDCGTTISLGRVEGYCNNAEWRGRYDACMICANTEGIWKFYRNAITPAAAACGLTAEPSPSGWVPTPTSTEAPVQPSSEAPVVPPSSAPAPVDPTSTAASAVTSAAPSAEQPSVIVPTPGSSAAGVPASSLISSAAAGEQTSSAVEHPVSSGAPYPVETHSHANGTAAHTGTEPCETDANGVPTGQSEPTTLVTRTTEVPGHVVVPTKSADAPVQPAPPAQTPGTGSPSQVATAPVVVESADATDGSVPVPSVVEVSGAGRTVGSAIAAGVAAIAAVAAL
ncbi:hypothetical protein HYQ45_013237 [Verticillium longisporum]|uniref:Uncharacterized protein n=1 Tax=Verticillium longisporum TaxID=100787 RepID=A0A8I2ZB44_VERLO|nr:hypothetical protein HYQ45_013237 [Verticillium longisporum]